MSTSMQKDQQNKLVVFDMDETLGYFSQLYVAIKIFIMISPYSTQTVCGRFFS